MPAAASLGAAVLERAATHPRRIAVDGRGGRLTYGELARAARATAGTLLRSGCRPGQRVGILAERDPATVVGMLASLLAGTTYVPLDPGWPRPRLEGVARDAGVTAVLAPPACVPLARALPATTFVPLQARSHADAGELPPVSARQPAYILYTSGSTGRAKGVVQSQANALRHASTYARALGVEPGDRLSLVASGSVDAAVMDVYGALVSGARVVVMDPVELAGDGPAESLARAGVTIFHSTPTVFRSLFADVAPGGAPSCLRLVVLGGEAVHPRDVRLFRSTCARGTLLVNNYGPTECTIALQAVIDHDTPAAGPVPIGAPVEGIDVELRLLPDGELGEIVLIGRHVALGYWGRDDLTARAFSTLPDGRRAFATGDLARTLPGGALEFVGRRDWRVTRHGHQLDPEEVERALVDIPGIREAVVVPDGDRLVAWAVLDADGTVHDVAAVRASLGRTLPGYMLPSGLVAVDALPRTVTGKIDRAVLAGLPWPEPPAPRAPLGPVGDLERAVARAWSAVLGGPAPDRHESLFARGGHSLDAARIAARVQAALGRAVSAPTVLRHPTVAGLAAAVARAAPVRTAPGGAPAAGRRERWPLAIAQERHWERALAAPRSSQLNVAVQVELADPVRLAALRDAAASVLRRHAALRTRFARHPAGAVQEVRAVGGAGLEVVPRGSPLDRVAARVAWAPYDLERGPLLRLVLVPRRDGSGTLVVAWHHLVMDGWGRLELESELLATYRRLLDGGDPEPGLGPDYHRFTAWQRTVRDEAGEGAPGLAHWRAVLGSAAGLAPSGRATAGGGARRAATRELSSAGDLGPALQGLARRAEVSPFVLLVTAFAVEIARLAGRRTVVVTTDSAGRSEPEAQRMVGMLANLLVLPLSPDPAMPFADALGTTAEVLRSAQEHEQAPLAQVIAALAPGALQRYDELLPIAFFADVERPEDGRATGREMAPRELSRDLIVEASLAPDRVTVSASFRVARLTPHTADALLRSYLGLLGRFVAAPDRPIGSVAEPPGRPADDRALSEAIRRLLPPDRGAPAPARRRAASRRPGTATPPRAR